MEARAGALAAVWTMSIAAAASSPDYPGVLPYQQLRALGGHAILAAEPLTEMQLQPASLDLRLGPRAYRVRASFLPGPAATVEEKIAKFGLYELDLTGGAVLERGCVYIVPLLEALDLPDSLSGIANPKSSTGRLDIFTRLITDRASEFDRIRPGYKGPLYAEISPRTFSVRVKTGTRLSQLRLRRGAADAAAEGSAALRSLHARDPLLEAGDGRALALREDQIDRGRLGISIDLAGHSVTGLVGFKAKRDAGVIDYDLVGHYDPFDFWEPLYARQHDFLVLNLDDFYILASKEAVVVPPEYAAEMVPYDTEVGEFRVHYAGFFDPGFGHREQGGSGSRAVLEVRPHEVPFMLEDGQLVGRLVYERLAGLPERLYGSGIGSTYQAQGLRLSKHFKAPAGA
jgi:dCTP deaminase